MANNSVKTSLYCHILSDYKIVGACTLLIELSAYLRKSICIHMPNKIN